MPSLTPAELQEARIRSGRLGGRPRLPTATERREATLDALIPASLRALAAHLGSEDERNPQAWRAAIKVIELRYGEAPTEPENVVLPFAADDIEGMTWRHLQALAASILVTEPAAIAVSGTTVETT